MLSCPNSGRDRGELSEALDIEQRDLHVREEDANC